MEKVLSGSHFSTFFQHSTISHALSPVMNNSLHAMFVTTCASRGDPLSLSPLLKCTTHSSLCSHPPFGLHKHSPTINERQRVQLYSCMEEFNDTSFLHLHFHVRCHSVRLPLCCHLSHDDKMEWNIGGKVQLLLLYHQHPPMILWANRII